MPAIDGVVSGFDTTGLIQAITGTMRVPIDRMGDELGTLDERKEAVTELSNKLEALATAAEALDEEQEAWGWTPSTTDESVVTVEASGELQPGEWSLEVSSLARASVLASDGVADPDSSSGIRTGRLTVTVGDVEHEVRINNSNRSMNGIAEALSQIEGLTATVLDDGSGDDPFRLVVRATDTGEANAVSIRGRPLDFTETVQAADTVVELDGIELRSATNQIENIGGVTMTVNALSTEPVRVGVSADGTALEEKLQTLVDAYNEVRSHYRKQTVFNPEIGLQGGLASDGTARRVMTDLSRTWGDTYTDGTFVSMSQLGIATQQNGDLALDTEALAQATADNPGAVRGLLTDPDGPLAALSSRIRDVFIDSDNGILKSRTDAIESSQETLRERIEARESQLENTVDRLRIQFGRMEQTMGRMQSTGLMLVGLLAGAAPSNSSL